MSNLNKLEKILIPTFSILLGFLFGAFIMVIFGYNPMLGYSTMFKGALGSAYFVGEVLREASPLILTALGFSVANTAGFFNIGLPGQALSGWLASVSFALVFPDLPRIILLPASILVGVLAGAICAGIPGMLKAYFGTSEVIVTIMMNYMILYFSNFIVRDILTNKADSTDKIVANASLRSEALSSLTSHSTLHGGFILALLSCLLVWFIMQQTTIGFELRAVGFNPHAARYAGMNDKKNIILAMVISGGLAGLAGVFEGLGNFQNIYVLTEAPAIGFKGMAVSLLGGGGPIGIVLSAILFGILKIGGLSMPLIAGMPKEIVDIVIPSIIFFVGSSYFIRFLINKSKKKVGSKKKIVLKTEGKQYE